MVCHSLLKKCFQTTGLCDLAETLVGQDNAHDFAVWAFGEGYLNLVGMDKFAERWNKKHSDLFKINLDSPIVYDMIKMTELWKLHNE